VTPATFRGSANRPLALQVMAHLRTVEGQPVEVVIRKPRSKRSLDQNAYAHAWPFKLIAEAMGESVEAAKLAILGEKFGWRELFGHQVPVKPSTSALSVEEFSELIEWMPSFGAHMFGLSIPLPNDVDDEQQEAA
jgi:hypothetical protein